MSDRPDRQEKVFDPSPTRLRKAREDGNVARSRELTAVGMLLALGALLVGGAPAGFRVLEGVAQRLFLGAADYPLDARSVQALLVEAGLPVLGVLAPLFGVVLVTGVALNVAQTGLVLTAKPLAPKLSRISPLEGAKRLFSTKGAFEAGKAFAKAAVVAPLAYGAIRGHLAEVTGLHGIPFEALAPTASAWVVALGMQMLLALGALAAVDYAFERWRWKTDLKMTLQEVKDETKEQEGDPHVKGRRRQKARELARRARLDHAVLQADVVVTNPTHYAVALKYDPAASPAPMVLAKGMRKRALAIKALAAEHGVPTVENVPLARALYASVDEGAAIDESLYAAVAAVLAEVYRQRGKTPTA